MPLINNLLNQGGGTLENNLGLPVRWVQFVGRSTPSPTNFSLAWGSSQAVATIDVNFDDLLAAIPAMLGTAERGGADAPIVRTLPMRNGYLPHMVLTKISNAQPILFNGKSAGRPDAILPIPATALFKYLRCTCLFTSVPFAVIDDTTLANQFAGDESKRFVEWKRVHTNYALTRKGLDFKWAEGGGTGPAVGAALSQSLIQPLSKTQLIATWRMIPERCLFPNGPLGSSPNIELALNGTNNAAWNGYETGTVLFDSWAPEPEEAPYPMEVGGDWVKPQRLWKVQFSLRRFKPPKGGTAEGWQLQPWSDGKWYKAWDKATGTTPVPAPVDFSKIFLPN